jgi:hypothetical protein
MFCVFFWVWRLKRLKSIRREGRREGAVAKEMCEGEREIMEAPDMKLMSSSAGVSGFKRICVFCGSSSGNKTVYLDVARELGNELVSSFFFFAAQFYTHPCFFATPIYHFVAMSLFLYSELLDPPHNVDDAKFAAETESQREKRTHANTPTETVAH